MFSEDPRLLDVPLAVSFSRLFELSENKGATVKEMFLLGWGRMGERGGGGGDYLCGRKG